MAKHITVAVIKPVICGQTINTLLFVKKKPGLVKKPYHHIDHNLIKDRKNQPHYIVKNKNNIWI